MIYFNTVQNYNGKKVIVNPVIEKTPFESLDTLLDMCFTTDGIISEVSAQQGERIRPYFEDAPVLRFDIEFDKDKGFFLATRSSLKKLLGSYRKNDLMEKEVLCYRVSDLELLGPDVSEKQIYALNFK